MLELILYAALLGLILSLMVGPVFFVLLETAIQRGFLHALFFDAGVVLADALLILAAFYGSEQFLLNLEHNPWVYLLGGAGITGYGISRFFIHRINPQRPKLPKKRFLMLKGFLLNFVNVGVLAYWLTMVVVVSEELEHNASKVLLYFGISLASYLLVDVVKILGARKLRARLTSARLLWMQRFVGVVLLAFGVYLVGRGMLMI